MGKVKIMHALSLVEGNKEVQSEKWIDAIPPFLFPSSSSGHALFLVYYFYFIIFVARETVFSVVLV